MKLLVLIFSFLTFNLSAQVNLKFDKRFVECEDKWVAFNMNEDSSFTYGFIYIDEQAGLTFNREGQFKIKNDLSFNVEKLKEASIKVRLQPNDVKVAWLPETMYKVLLIDPVPEWLKFYKMDTASAKRLYKWGFMYNGWNECAKALPYLLKAREVEPTYKGLNVEIAFSYNCLKLFDLAEQILEEELKIDPTNAYVNKEYIYTITKTKFVDKAITQYFKSLETIKDKSYNAENSLNILQYFYRQKDIKNFNAWYSEFQKWPNNNPMMADYASKMKLDIIK